MKWEKRKFNTEAMDALRPALGEDAAQIARECLEGISECFYISGYGWLVTRCEEKDLVVVAAVGRGSIDVIPVIKQIAIKHNRSIRIHSSRAGMARLLKRHGFEERERVYGWRQ